MAKRIYISGPITGLHPTLVQRIFQAAQKHLRQLGFEEVVNPTTLDHDHDQTWESYMIADIKELFYCDAIFMLKNWRSSRGARIEHAIAKELKLEIVYEQSPTRIWWLRRLITNQSQHTN
jgi:hypothetical protein